jgi:hypothetical protein
MVFAAFGPWLLAAFLGPMGLVPQGIGTSPSIQENATSVRIREGLGTSPSIHAPVAPQR